MPLNIIQHVITITSSVSMREGLHVDSHCIIQIGEELVCLDLEVAQSLCLFKNRIQQVTQHMQPLAVALNAVTQTIVYV